jgi:uncharacterized protein YndB with AHSA1/START domain
VSKGRLRLRRTIDAPITTVFRYLTDLERTPEWDTRVEKVTQMTRGSLRTGVILRSTLAVEGEKVHFDDEITDYEPPTRFGLRSVLGNTNSVSYALEEDDLGRTRFDVALSYDLPDPPPDVRLDDDALQAAISSAVDQSLDLFRDLVERERG